MRVFLNALNRIPEPRREGSGNAAVELPMPNVLDCWLVAPSSTGMLTLPYAIAALRFAVSVCTSHVDANPRKSVFVRVAFHVVCTAAIDAHPCGVAVSYRAVHDVG